MSMYRSYSDENLIRLTKENNRAAFTEIYERYRGVLYVFARNISQDKDDAADIVQDVFISLWDKRWGLELTTSLSSYLYSAVRYKFLDRVSHKKVRSDYVASFQSFVDKGHRDVDAYLSEKELKFLVEKEVAKLPAKMREVFELSRTAGLSHREIARQLDLSEKTVKNQVNNALKILRVKLGYVVILFLLLH